MAELPKILILNGPNLNLLGTRQPDVYGTETLADIESQCRSKGSVNSVSVDFRQSNSESELIGWIQDAREGAAGIIINAGAYTHTSIAILDALQSLHCPIIEVHLSNIFRREAFRHHSYVSEVATGLVCGLGALGYGLAIDAMAALIADGDKS